MRDSRAVQAAALLGCQGILVGVGPEMARALVSIDVDLGGIMTRGTLQAALAHAMGQLARAKGAR